LSDFYSEVDEEKSSNFATIADNIRRGVDKVAIALYLRKPFCCTTHWLCVILIFIRS
jgi:hypothetical protein